MAIDLMLNCMPSKNNINKTINFVSTNMCMHIRMYMWICVYISTYMYVYTCMYVQMLYFKAGVDVQRRGV